MLPHKSTDNLIDSTKSYLAQTVNTVLVTSYRNIRKRIKAEGYGIEPTNYGKEIVSALQRESKGVTR